jgi:hypothetical protein
MAIMQFEPIGRRYTEARLIGKGFRSDPVRTDLAWAGSREELLIGLTGRYLNRVRKLAQL